MARPIRALAIDSDQMKGLKSLTGRRSSPQRMVMRANIVLLRGQGFSQQEVAARLNVERCVVSKWENRFRKEGLAGLDERHRSGRPPVVAQNTKASILDQAVRPPKPLSRWSTRTMAKAKGVSNATVHRLWKANDIKPHLTRTFKLSNDKDFEPKFWDVIGLYLNPPDKALVFCCDEKSQCQALERTQPGLPLGMGHVRTATHDYIRHGTTTLFAALDIANGQVIAQCRQRHRHQEFLSFLKRVDVTVPAGLDAHLVVDNYATHKHPKVRAWLAARPRFHVHYTPTYSSWLNQVERWFAILTQRQIRRSSCASAKDLIAKIEAYIAAYNAKAHPFVWTVTSEAILEKVERICKVICGTGH